MCYFKSFRFGQVSHSGGQVDFFYLLVRGQVEISNMSTHLLAEWEKGEVGKGEKRMGETGKIQAKWEWAKRDWANWE